MMYDVKNLNIWKAGSRSSRSLLNSKRRQIEGIGDEVTIYMGSQLLDADIDDLCLSVRARNCLKRAGWNIVGDVINSIESWDDLLKIRCLGNGSAAEIKNQIIRYQDILLSENYRTDGRPVRRDAAGCAGKMEGLREWLD